jgi:hypothetical protein
MEHSVYTAEIKEASRRARRAIDKAAAREQLEEFDEDRAATPPTPPAREE